MLPEGLLRTWMIVGTVFTLVIGLPWLWMRLRARALRAERARLDRQLPENVSARQGLIGGQERRWLETDGVAPGVVIRPVSDDPPLPDTWLEPGSGDPAFDAVLHVSGNMLLARALLDAETRATLRRVLAGWGEVRDGQIRTSLDPDSPLGAQAAALLTLVERLRLLDAEATLTRLVDLCQGDPAPQVRALCFDTFGARGPSGSARTLARSLLSDKDPRVVVRAAAWLGEEAAGPLAALRTSRDPGIRALAVRGTARLRGAVELLRAHLADKGDVEAVVLALAETGDPAAEAPLIELLSVPGVVAAHAATALGALGTARAVPALHTLGTAEARAAIAAIQARIPDADFGRVSLVDGGGELSVADGGGELSLAGGGEVSMSGELPAEDDATEHSGERWTEDEVTEVVDLHDSGAKSE